MSEKKAVRVGLSVRVHIQVRREIFLLPVHKRKTFSYDSVSECKRTSNETFSYVNLFVTRRLYTRRDIFDVLIYTYIYIYIKYVIYENIKYENIETPVHAKRHIHTTQ